MIETGELADRSYIAHDDGTVVNTSPAGAHPPTLIGEAERIADAQRRLVRIGIDRPDRCALGSTGDLADPGQQLVPCAAGFPASTAASLLHDGGQDVVFALHSATRALAERGNSLLKNTFEGPRRVTPCPWWIGMITAAALVLLHHEHNRTTGSSAQADALLGKARCSQDKCCPLRIPFRRTAHRGLAARPQSRCRLLDRIQILRKS